jgi:hypothetical protein
MSIKGDLREWRVDIHALQHFTSVPPDSETGALYVDGEPYGSGGGDSYTHPNHSGDVTSVADGAQTIATGAVTNAKMANMAQNTIKGNDAVLGVPKDLTKAEALALLNVADGAQVNTVTSVNTETGAVVLTSDDISDAAQTNKWSSAARNTKTDYLTVTAATDLDTIRANTTTNNAKVTNATHTGEVTGSAALTLAASAVTARTLATPVGADHALIYDASGAIIAKALISLWPMTRIVAAVAAAATVTINASLAFNGIFKLTTSATAITTMAAPTGSPIDGQTMEIWIVQDATGSRTIGTWNAAFRWNAVGGVPTLTTTPLAVDILCFQYYSTTAAWMCTAKLLAAAI